MRFVIVTIVFSLNPLLCRVAAADELPTKTLAECIDIAVQQHPSLKAAGAAVDAGHQRVWEAASNYLPQVSANYAANRRNSTVSARIGGAPSINVGTQKQTFNFYSTGFSFTQVLFDFGQTLASIRSAQAAEQSLEADLSTQRDTVVLNVKQSYFDLLAAKRLLVVADETVHQSQKHLEQAQGRYDVGMAPKFDVTTAQVQLAQAELNQVTARNNVAVARETLRNALGLVGPLDFDIVDDFGRQRLPITAAAALTLAYDKRPELQSIQAQERSTEEHIASLQRNYLPNVSGNGAYDWTGTGPLQSGWNVGAAVNLSVFNGGLTIAQIGEAKANLSNLKFNEDVLRQNIALEVRQAVLNMEQAAEAIRVAEKGLQQARENLDLAEGRYKTGVGNIIELTDAQTSLTTAEANYVQALYSYQNSVAAVEKATAQQLPTT
ncbi:MAG TPA: TolC family protein [Candidatus Margulisiibacteriota bacterium]|nr:TolC family protein [Candidatus Margulisiibacteriota bacterium]